jgi:hypothetical protein
MAPIVVLGMHKSGTTLVSLMLHRSGIAMVDREEAGGYDEGNHFERMSTNALNKRLLDRAGGNSLRTFRPLDPTGVPFQLREDAANLVTELESRGVAWGFKDPRTCLTYGFWKQVLPAHKLICVYRAPSEVHAHYTGKRSPDVTRGIRTLRAWYEYNLGMLNAYRQGAPGTRLLIDYGKLMQDEYQLERLSSFVGRDVKDERVAGLRRAVRGTDQRLGAEAALLKLVTRRDVFSLAREISAIGD